MGGEEEVEVVKEVKAGKARCFGFSFLPDVCGFWDCSKLWHVWVFEKAGLCIAFAVLPPIIRD